MSGIAGVYYLNGRPVEDEIDRMLGAMEHRGPDGGDTWHEESVGLGHLMLRSTPEDQYESFPLVDQSGTFAITADVRLDNRGELIGALDVQKPAGRPITDGELVLSAYKQWGQNCPQKLLGAFAFVVWDAREKNLFCVRDHAGVKPLYYYYEPGAVFAFASEIRPLFRLRAVPKTPNEVKIAEHLMAPVKENVSRTYFKDIWGLAPAHFLEVSPDTLATHEYWALDPHREINLSSDEAYEERFRELFEDAVRVRLRSDHPVGSTLSGGLDSTSVACQATQILNDSQPERLSLHTFSAVFREATVSDESEYIEAALEKYDGRMHPHFFQGDEKSPLAEWDELSQNTERARLGPNIYIVWRAQRQAQNAGVRVLLSGFDGDVTVSHGTGYLNQLREEGKWLTLVREVKALAEKLGDSPKGAVWSWIRGPLLSLPGISQLVTLRRAVKNAVSDQQNEDRETASSEPAWRRAMQDDLLRRIEPHLEQNQGGKPSTEREHHYRRLTDPNLVDTLQLYDTLGAKMSIERRYPFFDKRLIEFCLALPPDQKLRKGWQRSIHRRAMNRILPRSIPWREKKGNPGPAFEYGMANYERSRLGKLRNEDIGGLSRFVKPSFLNESIPSDWDGMSSTRDGILVLRALSLGLWLRHNR